MFGNGCYYFDEGKSNPYIVLTHIETKGDEIHVVGRAKATVFHSKNMYREEEKYSVSKEVMIDFATKLKKI